MKFALTTAAVALGLSASMALAADGGTQVGVLTCSMTGIENVVVYTKEEFACTFKPNHGDEQTYTGVIKEIGVNLSITKDNTMVWGVIAPEKDLSSPDELKGTYLGGTGQVEVIGGAAVNILIGGSHQTISLQPISVNGMIGAGAALDIAKFELK